MIRHVQISEQTTYDLECHGIQPWFLSCRKLHPNLPVVILHTGKSAGNFTAKIVGKWMFHTKYSMFYLCFLICEKKHVPPNPGGVPPSLIFEVVIIMISLRMFKIDKQRLQFHIHEIYRFVTTPKRSRVFKNLHRFSFPRNWFDWSHHWALENHERFLNLFRKADSVSFNGEFARWKTPTMLRLVPIWTNLDLPVGVPKMVPLQGVNSPFP